MTGSPTKADLVRFDQLQRIGCLTCRKNGIGRFPVDIHHCLVGGRRIGHQATLPLCVWCHRGVPNEGMTVAQMTADYGPSLAYGSKIFRERYGSDVMLLAEVNDLIAELAA